MKPPIEPVVWNPPRAAKARPKSPLPKTRRIPLPARGEDVVIDTQGRLISGLEDGRIVRLRADGSGLETLAHTEGRPLGIELDRDGTLVVCDAERGVLRIHPERGDIEVLVDAKREGFLFCNNAALARDGSIYFSVSSRRFSLQHWRGDLIEHSGTGRLFKRTPDGQLTLLLDGLQFANGVALAHDESFVAVAETGAYRVTRYGLEGERRGWTDSLVDDLPGFPDNLASNERGEIWIAIASPRNPLLDALHRRRPLLRRLVWALPDRLQPNPERLVSAIAVDANGRVVRHVHGISPDFHMVTGMRERDGTLYLASLEEAALAALPLSDH